MSKILYIPTTSLNFNNIFASESISPAVFYSERKFGYKTLEKIELNCFDNSLLLYDKLLFFEIHDTDRDNYPMIIEIECICENLQPIKTLDGVSVYQLSDTIYLNPFSTKVYFFSEEKRKITVLGGERSENTKMVSLYEGNGCLLVCDTTPQFSFSKEILVGINDVDFNEEVSKNIEKDGQINRAKGFLYSFLIGANKSLNTKLVTIKKATREIGNIISAVIHSPDKSISSIQKQNVSKLCNDFADAYSRIDEIEKKIFDKIKELSTQNGLDADVAKKVLEKFNVLDQVKRDIIKQYRLTELFNIEYCLNNREWDEHTSAQIDKEVLDLESNFLNQKSKFNISETIHFANLKVTSFSVDKSDFYVSLINDYLSFSDTEETQTNIALKAGKILSQMYSEKNKNWDDSKTRKYINSLLANLQGRGDFSVLDHDDIFLRSLSIFVQSKNEIDRIEKALIDNLIPDFHFAFGLWGAFWGFANMPKTLTNELFLSEGLEYVSEVYKYIFKQIHGIELEGKIERKQVEKPQPTTVTISSKINEPADNTAKTATSNQSQLEQEPSDSEEHKSRDKTTKQEFIEKSSDAEINSLAERDREKTVSIESKNQKGQKGKSKQTGNKKTKKQQDQCDAPTLFEADAGFKPAKDFYKDSNAYSYVEYILPTAGKTREQFKVDLDWFQGNHNEWYNDTKKGNQKGWYYKNPKDNQSVLETFKKYLENKKTQKDTEKDGTKKSMQWLRDIYTSIDVDKIIGKLKSVYK